MRHYPELKAADARWMRVFELYRQQGRQTGFAPARDIDPAVAKTLIDRANRSFRPLEPYNSSVR